MTVRELQTETERLRYSRYERFIFWLTGRWPERVVQRRLDAVAKDERRAR